MKFWKPCSKRREKIAGAARIAGAAQPVRRLIFRQLVLEHARMITEEDLRAPAVNRWKMLRAAWRFARAGGRTPVLREGLETGGIRRHRTAL